MRRIIILPDQPSTYVFQQNITRWFRGIHCRVHNNVQLPIRLRRQNSWILWIL